MGAAAKFVRDLDTSKEVEAQLKEMMNVLIKLAQAKLAEFKNEMKDSWEKANDDCLAPGSTKDFQDEQMHVIANIESSPISESIGKIVDFSFALGNEASAKTVGDFIKTLVQVGLDTVLGTGGYEEHQYKQYIIYPDGNFLCRCDVWYWRYTIISKGFQQKLQHVVVYRVQYGAVDISQVNPIALGHWFDKWKIKPEVTEDLIKMAKNIIESATKKTSETGKKEAREEIKKQREEILKKRGIVNKAN